MSLVLREFQTHQASVRKLVNFDRDILDFVIVSLQEHVDRLKATGIQNPEQTGEKVLRVLRPIRTNDAFRNQYRTVFNQALVLLVSYFGSSVHTLFTNSIKQMILRGDSDSALMKERITFTINELCEPAFEMKESIPQSLALASDVSWQDMQSIHRTFKKYFEIQIPKNTVVNDIIAAQACRHVIVHAGGIVNERTIKQLANAKPRSIKSGITVRDRLQFDPEEIELVGSKMTEYLEMLESATADAIKTMTTGAIDAGT